MDKIFGIIGGLFDKNGFWDLFKGKERRLLDFQRELAKDLHSANQSQIELNKVEATHKSIFVAGWRPFIGWVCGAALAYQFILRDFISYIIRVCGSTVELPPEINISQLISILLAMLGMAGYRTFEKAKNVNKN